MICNSAQKGLIRQIDYFDKEIAQNESIENYTLINKGDFVYNPRKSLEAPYGPVNIYNLDETGIVSPLYLCFSVQNINTKFLHYYFKSKSWHRFVYLYGDSGARHDRVSIKDEVFFSQQLSIPTSHEEAEKITDFLYHIEQRIKTQSKIIENLKYYKKIISDNFLYSKDTISFKPLKEFGKLKNGYAFKSENYVENGLYNIITIANVSGDRYIQTKECNKIKDLPNDIQKHQVLQENDILISLTGNVGRVSLATNGQHLLNQRVGLFELFDKNLTEYIYQCLSNKRFEKSMILKGQGAAQLNIGKDDIENYLIPQPNNESKKVISLLSYIDKKISIEYSLLQKYREQKSFLLSNMFI